MTIQIRMTNDRMTETWGGATRCGRTLALAYATGSVLRDELHFVLRLVEVDGFEGGGVAGVVAGFGEVGLEFGVVFEGFGEGVGDGEARLPGPAGGGGEAPAAGDGDVVVALPGVFVVGDAGDLVEA